MLTLKCGDLFAGCRIVDICGHGGFGTVYLAENAVGKPVAVKIVNTPDKEAELKGLRCYMAESPRSPYLLPILHVGIERDELFYIMEAADPLDNDAPRYIADTLGRRLKLNGRLAPETALEVTRKIAMAVEQLHGAGLIHRDIKPDNIIFVGGEPMLSDPGLLHPADCSATLAGTLGFLPPECFSGAESNSMGSDIYALGKVFYCALSGAPPGRYPQLPRELGTTLCRKLLPVLLKACNEKKNRRFADIGELRRALPDKLPAPGPLERCGEKFRCWRLMHPRLWTAALLALLCVLLLGGYGAYSAERRRQRTEREYAAMDAAVAALRERFATGGERLRLQLLRALGGSEAETLAAAPGHIPKRPAAALEYCAGVDRRLRQAAEKLAAAAWKIADPLRRSGELRSLLDSPLGGSLPELERRSLARKLDADEQKHGLIRPWQPSPGRLYYPESSRSFEFASIPPGDFVSPRTGKIVRIDYPLWVSTTELSVRQFSRLGSFIPAGNRDLYRPVTRLVWNDLLFACRRAGSIFQFLAPLPPGYLVRPLTEEEWEYCALAGMRSAPAAKTPTTAAKRRNGPDRPGGGDANPFGLYDLTGNVREAVLSGEHGNPGAYILRGAGWNSRPEVDPLTIRAEVAFYQSFMPDAGTRLAVAPGDPELFERE
ncbi:MAG: protein kinase, partial [Lentisphaeria bacterium]|nr:protein kinase [Lentisphaeria bacterium]